MQLIEPGLSSATRRQLAVESVVEFAAKANLSSVEWGGDVHVPPGDLAAAEHAARATAEAGLRVAGYASYFRPGVHGVGDFGLVLETARALGAPRVRIWAGRVGSTRSTSEQRRQVVETTRAIARRAAAVGIDLAFESSGGTLTDELLSTERLLAEVDRPNVLTYWQPAAGAPDAEVIGGLERLLPKVTGVHILSWRSGHDPHPLCERAELWRVVLDRLAVTGKRVDVLLEFVPNDDAEALHREGSTLRELLENSWERSRNALFQRTGNGVPQDLT